MLHYPKMPGSGDAPLERCIAFEKCDGTNLHFDWDRDFGWHAFGTRRDTFNFDPAGVTAFAARHAHLHEAAAVFQATLADPLDERLRALDGQAFVAFAEFLGPNSFAGLHRADDPKELRLFDVRHDGGEFLDPWAFVAAFAGLPTARVVYEGKLTGKFADDVRQGRYGVMEGVVCKGGTGPDVWRVKIKTHAYLARLKAAFAERWEEFWE
jgi:hypothetical protein